MNKRQKKKHGQLYSQRLGKKLDGLQLLLDQANVLAEKMLVERNTFRLRAHQAEARLSDLRNPWFVRLECERGLNDPLIGFTVQIHPEEFSGFLHHSPKVRTAPGQYSYDVSYWADYAAHLLKKTLVEYISGEIHQKSDRFQLTRD